MCVCVCAIVCGCVCIGVWVCVRAIFCVGVFVFVCGCVSIILIVCCFETLALICQGPRPARGGGMGIGAMGISRIFGGPWRL